MKTELSKIFAEHYGAEPQVVACAPGRIEILGNHTDYNLGTTLSAAVDRYIWCAVKLNESGICRVWDEDFGSEARFDLASLDEHNRGEWINYVKGCLAALRTRGVTLSGFDMVLKGNVPLSAGMSSSAALEMSVLMALDRAMSLRLDWLSMAKAGQWCENEYIGAKTGLLDQFSSLRGKKDCLVYSDFRSFETEQVALPAGYSFVIVNSMVKHNLANEYTDRRRSCEAAAAALGVSCLRDARYHQLFAGRRLMDERALSCAAHVVGEISRVAEARSLLGAGDAAGFGKLLWESHDSSRVLFDNSCAELDRIIDAARGIGTCLGARLSGGGFGGITIHLVRAEDADSYLQEISRKLSAVTGVAHQLLKCSAADGAHCL